MNHCTYHVAENNMLIILCPIYREWLRKMHWYLWLELCSRINRLSLLFSSLLRSQNTRNENWYLATAENRIPAGSDAKRGYYRSRLSRRTSCADIIELPGEFARRAAGDRFQVSDVLSVARGKSSRAASHFSSTSTERESKILPSI